MENRAYQVQWMLADKLDAYKKKRNKYMNNNIKEIQDLYRDKEQRRKSRKQEMVDKEVVLFKLYKMTTTISKINKTTKTSFI